MNPGNAVTEALFEVGVRRSRMLPLQPLGSRARAAVPAVQLQSGHSAPPGAWCCQQINLKMLGGERMLLGDVMM